MEKIHRCGKTSLVFCCCKLNSCGSGNRIGLLTRFPHNLDGPWHEKSGEALSRSHWKRITRRMRVMRSACFWF